MSQNKNKIIGTTRPPIVVVMGHIDHGKSTLLDYIRKTSITEREAGGITQRISAYEAEVSVSKDEKRKIVFLDTPGHEAFFSTRESGSKVADIAVLVVSAEDGVKPQTLEAIKCAKNDAIPFIVVINKIDKPNANIDKTKQELAENEVFVEGWGGTVPVVAISAKTGEGVDELLETILLQGDMENLSSDPLLPASGLVLESNRDSKKGISVTLIIKNGTLKKGMFVRANTAIAPVRIMEDFLGNGIESAPPSKPVSITGWSEIPEAGIPFYSYETKQEAEKDVKDHLSKVSQTPVVAPKQTEVNTKVLPIIIKSDALGSLSALEYELSKLNSTRIALRVIYSGIGPINESDVKLSLSSTEIVLVGFRVGVDNVAKDLSQRHEIMIKTFDVIYELVDWVSEILKERTPKEEVEEITGTAKIVRIFSVNKNKQIIGGAVESGEIQVNGTVRIMRRDIKIGEGKIKELQSQKIKTSLVEEGKEFGMMIDSKTELVPGDKIQAYKITTK